MSGNGQRATSTGTACLDASRSADAVQALAQTLGRVTATFPPRRARIVLTSALDAFAPKHPATITFVCKRRFGYSGNIRVLCEAFGADGRYRVQLWCETPLSTDVKRTLEAQGIALLTWGSLRHLWSLVSSGIVVVDHSIRDAYIVHAHADRAIINVWHGVPIKRIELDIRELASARRRVMRHAAQLYDALIANSADDRLAIARAFGTEQTRVAPTGLPRLDILTGHHPIAADLARDQASLRRLLAGRTLVLYAPTFREHGPSPLAQLTESDWAKLDATARACDAVIGVRPHPYDRTPHPHELTGIISLWSAEFPETNLVLREAQVLVTDFSSIWVDYLVLNRPILGFAKDLAAYTKTERGFLYDLDEVFPGPFSNNVDELAMRLREVLEPGSTSPDYSRQRALFHDAMPPPYTQKCVDLIVRVARAKHRQQPLDSAESRGEKGR